MSSPLYDPRHPWARLLAAARTWRDERDNSAPAGFATRVSALALAVDRPVAALFEHFALRALGLACLLAILSVAVNYREVSQWRAGTTPADDALLPVNDAVAVVLALAE
jgi:hypothetical protein